MPLSLPTAAPYQLHQHSVVALCSEMNMAYEGQAPLCFQVLVLKNGAPFQRLELDPTDKKVKVSEVKTTRNKKTSWRFSGKSGEVTIPENAARRFLARLVAAPNPTLQVRQAELVLKK